MKPIAALLILTTLAGCAGSLQPSPMYGFKPSSEAAACRSLWTDHLTTTRSKRQLDYESDLVLGFPYLRTNRYLASFKDELHDDAVFQLWVSGLAAEAREAYLVETVRSSDKLEMRAPALECQAALIEEELSQPNMREFLKQQIDVRDDYTVWRRIFGIYPITKIGVARGFEKWKKDNLPLFGVAIDEASLSETSVVFEPRAQHLEIRNTNSFKQMASLFDKHNIEKGMGISLPQDQNFTTMLDFYAPIWVVDKKSVADQLGKPVLSVDDADISIAVDTNQPVTFARLSYTRFHGDILPQLTYMIWFSDRPKTGVFDLLSGSLDAVMWRVTIGKDGHPLIYDTIHACGCYHLFFPTSNLNRIPMPEDLDLREEALVVAKAPHFEPDQRIAVRLASGSHYVTGLGTVPTSNTANGNSRDQYDIVGPLVAFEDTVIDDAGLRLAPVEGFDRLQSIYGRNGLIPQSQRLERWTLWPMGIRSAGAMRQWGNHATAFVGKRHFDDPYLFERAFEYATP